MREEDDGAIFVFTVFCVVQTSRGRLETEVYLEWKALPRSMAMKPFDFDRGFQDGTDGHRKVNADHVALDVDPT